MIKANRAVIKNSAHNECYVTSHITAVYPRAIQVDGYSLDAQKDKLRKYAEYQDMTIVSEFSDEGFSGKNIKGRPEFTRMMEKIESGEDGVDFVLVFMSKAIARPDRPKRRFPGESAAFQKNRER